MKRIVLLTVHPWNSKRKAGFHWLADAYHRNGAEALFFTCSLSPLSVFTRDERLQNGLIKKRNRIIEEQEGLFSYAWFTPWHPGNMLFDSLNKVSSHIFNNYGDLPLGESESFMQRADMFIFESCAALMLFPRLKELNPKARFVYRVSDDLRLLKSHPVIIRAEEDYAKEFDLVSVPNAKMLKLFSDESTNVQLHLHGINKELFDADYPNPYDNSSGPNAVFVGTAYFDIDFIERAGRLFTEWTFHVIGPINGLPDRSNIRAYGEISFTNILPYIKHADVGLHTLSYKFGSESLGDSLKVIQYSYCGLPIIVPDFISSNRSNMFFYKHGNDNSIREAMQSALTFDRGQTCEDGIMSWDELAKTLKGDKNE